MLDHGIRTGGQRGFYLLILRSARNKQHTRRSLDDSGLHEVLCKSFDKIDTSTHRHHACTEGCADTSRACPAAGYGV